MRRKRSGEIDVLVIEDDPAALRLLAARLAKLGYEVATAGDGKDGWEIIQKRSPKVVLSDWNMPEVDGVQLCRLVKSDPDTQDVYFVLVTANEEISSMTQALDSGADDYLIKPYDFRELLARLRVGFRVWTLQHDLKLAAITDMLTGLYNQHHFLTLLDREFGLVTCYGKRVSLIFVDIDHFKKINDAFGHEAGNRALAEVARTLEATLRETDILGRYGGDEFAAVLPYTDLAEATALAQRFLEQASEVRVAGCEPIGLSVGVACSDDVRVSTANDLLNLADKALYQAKTDGRGCVRTSADVADPQGPGGAINLDKVRTLKAEFASFGQHVRDVYVHSVFALVEALEARDPYMARHSRNVAWYVEQLAEHMNLGREVAGILKRAAMLHDVGTVGVPDKILHKSAPLTEEEWQVLKRVPIISTHIVEQLGVLTAELPIIRHHREWYDGSGYPSGLAGEDIPLGARVLAAADAFDAMTTDRAYRDRKTSEQAVSEIESSAGRQFDPKVVQALKECWRANRQAWQDHVDRLVRWTQEHSACLA